MSDLSYTQELYLCAVNEKGKLMTMRRDEASAGLVAGVTMELLELGLVALDDKDKLVVSKSWGAADDQPEEDYPFEEPSGPLAKEPPSYLRGPYETIAAFKKPSGIDKVAEHYLFGMSGKPFQGLLREVGASLWAVECADEVPGKDGAKKRYAPRREATMRVIEKLRAEFLEAGAMSDETVCLALLLDRSGLIRDYFSKIERATWKARVKEVRQSELAGPAKAMFEHIDAAITAVMVCVMAASTV